MRKLFISYSRANQSQVELLASDLKALGYTAWFDEELNGGKSWWDQILENIRTCDVFVFALSNDSLESMPCQREYKYAQALGKPILPVVIAEGVSMTLLPKALTQLHMIDYKDAADKGATLAIGKALSSIELSESLPSPLPEPPAVPISYITELKTRLDATVVVDQATLLLDVKESLRNPATREDARTLLKQFRQTPNLLAKTEHEIDELLAQTPAIENTDGHWRKVFIVICLLAVAALGSFAGWKFLSQPPQDQALQSEPVQSEPLQSEPLQSEPLQSEPLQSEPLQSEPLQSEPPKIDSLISSEQSIEKGESMSGVIPDLLLPQTRPGTLESIRSQGLNNEEDITKIIEAVAAGTFDSSLLTELLPIFTEIFGSWHPELSPKLIDMTLELEKFTDITDEVKDLSENLRLDLRIQALGGGSQLRAKNRTQLGLEFGHHKLLIEKLLETSYRHGKLRWQALEVMAAYTHDDAWSDEALIDKVLIYRDEHENYAEDTQTQIVRVRIRLQNISGRDKPDKELESDAIKTFLFKDIPSDYQRRSILEYLRSGKGRFSRSQKADLKKAAAAVPKKDPKLSQALLDLRNRR